jgi:hypothetical protein
MSAGQEGGGFQIVANATGGRPCPLRRGIGDQLIGLSGPESMRNSTHVYQKEKQEKSGSCKISGQKGFRTTSSTIAIKNTVGTSLAMR